MASGRNRNEYVDIMRGVAMLLVVLDHTMTGATVNSESSFLFNIVWSLQMPLFILISGYVTRYSRAIDDGHHLLIFFKKRSIAYLLPWCVWTFFVRGIIFQQRDFLNPHFILWHMDNGYWFLFTIWTITMIFGISEFIASMLYKKGNQIVYLAVVGIVYVAGMGCLAGVGMAFGLSFLCIKLTLYYMPFFFAGFLYGQLQDQIFAYRQGDKVISISVAASLAIWLVMLTRFNIYEISDGGIGIIVRAVTSLTGCIAVVGLGRCIEYEKVIGGGYSLVRPALSGDLSEPLLASEYAKTGNDPEYKFYFGSRKCDTELSHHSSGGDQCSHCSEWQQVSQVVLVRKSSLKNFLIWVGNSTLEIYLLHGLVLNLISLANKPDFLSAAGIGIVSINFILTVLLCFVMTSMIRENRLVQKTLFGK